MKLYLKKYTQGFLFAILFPIMFEVTEGISDTGDLKYWIVLVLVLPVFLYCQMDFSKEFMKNKMFSRANFIMYFFVFLGIISSLICMVLVGLFKV